MTYLNSTTLPSHADIVLSSGMTAVAPADGDDWCLIPTLISVHGLQLTLMRIQTECAGLAWDIARLHTPSNVLLPSQEAPICPMERTKPILSAPV